MVKFLSRFFAFRELHTNFKTEFIAGLTTFSTMAYVIFVNPQILSQAGMDFDACMVATIVASAAGTFCMGIFANYPFALAPGMGINTYFTYGIVLDEGYTWQVALGASFLAGLSFLLLNLVNLRTYLLGVIPVSLRLGTIGGVGFFLALIGMKNGGIIVSDPSKLVSLGNISKPEVFLNLVGIIIIGSLMAKKFRAAIFIGIAVNWAVGLIFGVIEWHGVFDLPPDPSPTLFKLNIWEALHPKMIPVVLSFIFVALFETAGTLLGLAGQAGFLDEKGRLPRAKEALYSDPIGTMAGAVFGTSPVTVYLESASGIAAGGKTGMTAIVVAVLFLLSLFLSPLASSIPNFATSPALIIIGAMMMTQVKDINWKDPSEFIPAFLILITIPLSYSISTGIAIGFIVYPLIKLFSGKVFEFSWIIWIISALFALKFVYG